LRARRRRRVTSGRRTGPDSSSVAGGARGAVGGGGAARGGDGVPAAGLRARVRAVLPVPARHGELPVRAAGLRVVPRRLPLHVPRQVLPRPLPLVFSL